MSLRWAGAAGINSITFGLEWPGVTSTPTIDTTYVRANGTSWRIAPGATKQVQHTTYATGQGVHYYRIYISIISDTATSVQFITLNNSSNVKLGFTVFANSTLQLTNIEDSVQVGATSVALSNEQWYRLELMVDDTTLSATSVEARLYWAGDESTLLWNPSGTMNLAAAPNRFTVKNSNDGNLDFAFTDVVLIESDATAPNTWAGPGSIMYLRPNGNSGSPQWARGGTDSGANWSQVDENPPNDVTDYVESNTNNQIDDYTLEDPSHATLTANAKINWVAPYVRFAISNTTGADPDFVLRVTANGVTEESGNVSGAGSTSYAAYQTSPANVFPLVLTNMPGSSVEPWTKADLTGATLGIRETATDTHLARVSALALLFDFQPGYAPPIFQKHTHYMWRSK